MTPPPSTEAVLVELLSLRIESWFRDARARVAGWDPSPCPPDWKPGRSR